MIASEMILVRKPLFVVGLVAMSASCVSQNCDPRSGPPIQMQVQLSLVEGSSGTTSETPSVQSDPMHRDDAAGANHSHGFDDAMQIRVQLQDALGGTLQDSAPNAEGKLTLMTCKEGTYRLRVTGLTIEEAVVEDLQPGRGDKLVNVTLRRRATNETGKAQGGATVSTQRLKIPKKAQKQLEKGDAAFKKGDLGAAEAYYTRAAEIYPQFEQAENNLGIVLMREGKKPQGEAAFERAVAINSRYAPAQVNLAKIAFDEKRFHDASELAKQALKTEPLNTAALFVATQAAFFTGDYNDTISYARTLHSLPHKDFAFIHFLAARSLEAEQRPLEAIGEYQTFIAEDPRDPNAPRAREFLTLLQASRLADSTAPH